MPSEQVVVVRLFASAREIAGKHEITMMLDGNQIMADRLRQRIVEAYPGLGKVPFALAVNRKVPTDETKATIGPGAEVAVLPAVSGG